MVGLAHSLSVAMSTARGRRLSLLDPSHGLDRLRTFDDSDTDIDTSVLFGARDMPLTVALRVKRSAAGSTGLLFEFGSSGSGLAAWIDGEDVGFAAGDGSGDSGVDAVASACCPALDQTFALVFSVLPGTGEIRAWRDGREVIRAQAVAGSFAAWADAGNGAIGTVSGTVTSRAAQTGALTNAAIVGPVSVYRSQLPRQF